MKQLGVPVNYMKQFVLDSLKAQLLKLIYPDRKGVIALAGNEPGPYQNFERAKANYIGYVFKQTKTGPYYTQHPTKATNTAEGYHF